MRNLLTNEEKKIVRREYCWRLVSVLGLALLITAVIGLIFLIPSYILARSKYKVVSDRTVNARTDSTSKKIATAKATLASVAAKEVYVATMLTEILPTDIIDAITAERGETIWIEGFSFQKAPSQNAAQNEATAAKGEGGGIITQLPLTFQSVSIRGIARDRTSLTEFAKRLEKVPMVKSVDVPVSNFEKGRGIDFAIDVMIQKP